VQFLPFTALAIPAGGSLTFDGLTLQTATSAIFWPSPVQADPPRVVFRNGLIVLPICGEGSTNVVLQLAVYTGWTPSAVV
jgi:hypothetical protein